MMPTHWKKLHPTWTTKPQDKIYGVIITPDLDSLMAAAIHKKNLSKG